jgi:hypothetical protein
MRSRQRAARIVALVLTLLMLLTACGASGGSPGDTTPDAEEGGDAGAPSMPAPVDRACVMGEEGLVTAAGLSLAGYGCTEVVNRSGIAGGRSWCCPSGKIEPGDTGAGGAQ